jgi:type VI secretion system protein ImpK
MHPDSNADALMISGKSESRAALSEMPANVAANDWPEGLRLVPEKSMQERLSAVKAAENPLLEAAQPLLRALADMPLEFDAASVSALHRLLEREIVTFQALGTDAQIRHEHVVAASYALCTALDEAAGSTAWGGGRGGDTGVWSMDQLASSFHGDAKGGDKVFLLIGRLASAPREHIDLLELLYQVLGLGFKGRFSTATDGERQLETVRSRLLALLTSTRGDVPSELSPHWQGVGTGKFQLLRSLPVWVTASLLSLVLFGLYGWYKNQLAHLSSAVGQRIAAIDQRPVPPSVPTPTAPARPLRLKELLSAEIGRGTVSVDEDAQHSAVSFKGDDMFVPGQARLSARILPVLDKVAQEIARVAGTVRISGHSDNLPIKTQEFPDNQILSEKRAQAVAEVLRGKGVAASRLQMEGKGDTLPVASNATAAGRAKNRRVEVSVAHGAIATSDRSSGMPAPASVPDLAAPPAMR